MGTDRRVIGVDESGKGDFFGPLVTAAFVASDSQREELEALGVRDGKLIADKKLLRIDEALREVYPHTILILNPEEYNQRYDKIRNLNKLLAEQHADAIQQANSASPADLAISDKFGKSALVKGALARRKESIELRQLVRGERIIQVAAASILARAAFLRAMMALADEYGMPVPKGAAPQVDRAGRDIVARHGAEVLPKLAKMHFKNLGRVVKTSLF